MKLIKSKVFLLLLLAIVSNSARAEWKVVSIAVTNKGATVYADPATISKDGNKVTMWTMYDFKTVRMHSSGKTFMSSMSQVEFDCKVAPSRVLTYTLFSKNMGDGEVVYSSSDADQWHSVEPVSAHDALWKVACGK